MFGYVSGFFSDETEGIRSRSLALKKSCNMLQLFILYNTASITKNRLSIPNKKKYLLQSWKEKLLYAGIRKSQSPQPLPPSSPFHRDEGLSPLIPNANLSALALHCCGGPGCTPNPRCGAGCSHCCLGRWAGHWPQRCQTQGLCSGCCLLAIAVGGKWFGSAPASHNLENHPHSWRGEHCKVSMSLA